MTLPRAVVDRVIDAAIEEDAGRGDVTTAATLDAGVVGEAHAETREPIVVAGVEVFARVFARVDPDVAVECLLGDGQRAEAGQFLARVHGRLASILMAERVALNLLQRMCGIATMTAQFVEVARRGGPGRVCDTRKTTPGLRALERWAVRCGGGHNHRDDLASGILIKDNHVAACGGVGAAVLRARTRAPHPFRIEVEVRTLAQLDEAIEAGADIVLLDDMDVPTLAEAVKRAGGRVLLEASGGVRLDTIEAIAWTGVDIISAGALTHSVRAVDISLEVHGPDPA